MAEKQSNEIRMSGAEPATREVLPVILAAGQGTRMKSDLPKALHLLGGRPMVDYVVEEATAAAGRRPLVVIGFQAEKVRAAVGDRAAYVVQEEQLGTGHAVATAAAQIKDFCGTVLILPVDTPLIRRETLKRFIEAHHRAGAGVTMMTARVPDPSGYGRVVRDAGGSLVRVVEDRDAEPAELAIDEINTSIYCFDNAALQAALPLVGRENAQGEYYLPDTVRLIMQAGRPAQATLAADVAEVAGINNRVQLAEAEAVLRRRVLDRLMLSGVTIIDPASTYIDDTVRVERDVTILPFTILSGRTAIGPDCRIGPLADIRDSAVGRASTIQYAVVEASTVGEAVTIGPFSHLRAGNEVAGGVRIGNYAELKNSKVGAGTKISHHSYIGDADIGERVNIGAGVVVVNYDGLKKSRTEIGDDAFVGCNDNLVAPLKIGRGAYTAAGSTLTKEVPEDALAVARVKGQTNIEGWAKRRRERAARKETQEK